MFNLIKRYFRKNRKSKIYLTQKFAMILCVIMPFPILWVKGIWVGIIDTGILFLFFNREKVVFSLKNNQCFFLLLFASFVGLSTIVNIFNGNSRVINLFLYIRMLLLFSSIFLAIYISYEKNRYVFFKCIFFGLIFSLLIANILFWFNIRTSSEQQLMWFGNNIEAHLRAGGIVGNTGALGYQITLVLPAFFLAYRETCKSKLYYISFFMTAIIVSYTVMSSSSRGALIGIIVFLFLFLIGINFRERVLVATIFLSGFITAILLAYLTFDHNSLCYNEKRIGINSCKYLLHDYENISREERLKINNEISLASQNYKETYWKYGSVADNITQGQEKDTNVIHMPMDDVSSGRFGTWRHYSGNILKHMWFGIGYKNTIPFYGAIMDNSFLTVLVESGIFSFIFYIMIWIGLLAKIVAFIKNKLLRDGFFMLGLVMSSLIQSVFLDIYSQWISFPIFLVMVYSLMMTVSNKLIIIEKDKKN